MTQTTDENPSIRALAEELDKVPNLVVDAESAWGLAHALVDIQESCVAIVQLHFPALLQAGGNPEEIRDTLQDIAEDLGHIYYHLRDTPYFQYVTARYDQPGSGSGL